MSVDFSRKQADERTLVDKQRVGILFFVTLFTDLRRRTVRTTLSDRHLKAESVHGSSRKLKES
jgi:hypothetical protein